MNLSTLDRLNASACGTLFCGRDRKTAELMRVSAKPLTDGSLELYARWGDVNDEAPFTVTRTFTKVQYAAEWIDAHLVPFELSFIVTRPGATP